MKILKHGFDREFTVICERCGCSYTITKDDVEIEKSMKRGRMVYSAITIHCPECNWDQCLDTDVEEGMRRMFVCDRG